jgi:hypothetical protein
MLDAANFRIRAPQRTVITFAAVGIYEVLRRAGRGGTLAATRNHRLPKGAGEDYNWRMAAD